MRIEFAHVALPGNGGRNVNVAVFCGRSASGSTNDNAEVLARWTIKARAKGLNIEKSALAFEQSGRIRYQGSRDLVEYLARRGVPPRNHVLDE